MKKMKEAMWKVDESGEFRFSDATNPAQALLFTPRPNFDALRRAIIGQFHGREATVGEIEDFVLAWTPFRVTHYKRQVLAELERVGKMAPLADLWVFFDADAAEGCGLVEPGRPAYRRCDAPA